MTWRHELYVSKFHDSYRDEIGRLRLHDTTLLEQLDSIVLTTVRHGTYKHTRLNSINIFFEILAQLPAWYLRMLKASGIGFLFNAPKAWTELEYLIHAACPERASARLAAFTNIVNYANGIYIKEKNITTTKLSGSEYYLRVHSQTILRLGLFNTQLFLELRTIASSIDKFAGQKTTLTQSLKAFIEILSILNTKQVSALKGRGLRTLIDDKGSWVQLEFLIYSVCRNNAPLLRIKQLGNLINYANGIYEQSEFITTTNHCGLETLILHEAYMVSIEFFNALVAWKAKKLEQGTKHGTIRCSLTGIIRSIVHIKNSTAWKNEFTDQGLEIFNANTKLTEELKALIPQYNHITMNAILSNMGISYPLYRIQIKAHDSEVFLKNTNTHSNVIFNELKELAEKESFYGLKKVTVKIYFSSFDSFGLPLLKEILSESEFKSFCDTGLSYLDNPDIYDRINEHINNGNRVSVLTGLAILKIYLKKEINLIKPSPYNLYFSGLSRNNKIVPIGMDILGNISEKAFNELNLKHKHLIKNIDDLQISEISYYSQLQDFVAGLKKVLPQLSTSQIKSIKDNGLSAFRENNCQISISCLESFQSLVKNKKANTTTIRGYRNAFRKILSWFIGEIPDVYPISTSKDEYIKKLSYDSDKYYTEEEIKELAFYIEKALISDNTTLRDKIYLYYARIQIKTGWNQQPLLDLSLNNLIRKVNPINNSENYELTIIKNRRSYKPSNYTFSRIDPKDSVLRSVINDILFVRDNLTSELRKMRFLDNYLFIEPCQTHGARRIESLDLHRLPKMILSMGCPVHYNPRKIRLGGVNFIYKHIARSVREHENLALHNYQTFLEKYKEISQKETTDTLSESIRIMSEYFSGKEIFHELHAIDNINNLSIIQETPTGICVSEPDSDEVKRYNRLNAKNINADNKYCGDFLACIWCKYFKVVKDADHIWKLLSYRNYIISTMERAVVKNESPEGQRAYTEILSRRVDDLIAFVAKTRPDVVSEANSLIKKHGLHADWEFALSQPDNSR